METVLIIAAVGAMCIGCFFVGAKVGQTTSRGEDIKLPTVNPIEIIREHQERKANEKEQDKVAAILENIENYDGTANGQREVPR